MRHISDRLLNCSCTWYKQNGYNEDREADFSAGVSLSKVWVTSSLASNNGSIGKVNADRMSLTYSVYSSLPRGITFNKGDKITYNNEDFIINSIEPVYADGLSHYLIGLN